MSEPKVPKMQWQASDWAPLVQRLLRRHGLAPAVSLRMGDTATLPVALCDDRWAVKFFAADEEPQASFDVESEALLLLRGEPRFPAPRLVAYGRLHERETAGWAYLITTQVPGVSLGSVRDRVRFDDLVAVAGWLGEHLPLLHDVNLTGAERLRSEWDTFTTNLGTLHSSAVARNRACGLATRLLNGFEHYAGASGPVDGVRGLVDRGSRPRLLHGDLHAWHIYGAASDDRFTPHAVIDLGDAMVGDVLYDLVPLHIKSFRGDKRLLRAFATRYGLDLTGGFVQRAMEYTLLFDFGRFRWDDRGNATTLQDLAERLWDVEREASVTADLLPAPGGELLWTIVT